jgi:exportin-7
MQLTRAYFAFLEVLFNSHITFILSLDTNTFMHIVGSLESGLKGLDTNISSQVMVTYHLHLPFLELNRIFSLYFFQRILLPQVLSICFPVTLLLSNSLNFSLQCASSVDNLAAFYFNNITMGEAPNLPAAVNLARHIAECPTLFPEVNIFKILRLTS